MQQRTCETFHDTSYEQSQFSIPTFAMSTHHFSGLVDDGTSFSLSTSTFSLHHACCCRTMCSCCR
jgi:hypothetical protein